MDRKNSPVNGIHLHAVCVGSMCKNWTIFSVQNFHDMTFDFQYINIFVQYFFRKTYFYSFYFSTKSATVQKKFNRKKDA